MGFNPESSCYEATVIITAPSIFFLNEGEYICRCQTGLLYTVFVEIMILLVGILICVLILFPFFYLFVLVQEISPLCQS